MTISLVDINGRQVVTKEIAQSLNHLSNKALTIDLDVSSLPHGTYFLCLGDYCQKIVIK